MRPANAVGSWILTALHEERLKRLDRGVIAPARLQGPGGEVVALGKIRMEPKEALKSRLSRSPDQSRFSGHGLGDGGLDPVGRVPDRVTRGWGCVLLARFGTLAHPVLAIQTGRPPSPPTARPETLTRPKHPWRKESKTINRKTWVMLVALLVACSGPADPRDSPEGDYKLAWVGNDRFPTPTSPPGSLTVNSGTMSLRDEWWNAEVDVVDRDTGDQTTLRDSGRYTATKTWDGFVLTLFSTLFDRQGLPPWRKLFTEYEGFRITVKDARLSRSTDELIFER